VIHEYDNEVIASLLKTEEIPQDIEAEYEMRRLMYHGAGGSGHLGPAMLVDMLRFLGYGRVAQSAPPRVVWREHVGDAVIATYGDKELSGILANLGDDGMLSVLLEGFDSEVELPAYHVRLAPNLSVEVKKK
jgi:hypothetical protein